MVVEVFSVALFFTLGWLTLRPFAVTTGYAFIASTALPIGIAAWAVACLGLVALRIPFDPSAGWFLAVLIAGYCNFRWKISLQRRELIGFAGSCALVLVATAVFAYVEWSVFNADMHWTLYMSDNLIDHGFISDKMRRTQLGADPLYLPMLSAIPRKFGGIYFVSFSPLMIVCTGALFAVLGIRANGIHSRLCIWLPILGAATLVSCGLYLINALQTKTHVVYAFHMLAVCGTLYFASRERKSAWFILALLLIAPMVVCRLEAGVSALPLLIVALAIPSVPIKLRLLGVASVGLAWGLSYFYLIGAIIYLDGTFDRGFISKRLLFMGALSAGLGIVLLLAAFAERHGMFTVSIKRLLSWLPALMIGTLVVLLAGHAALWPDTFVRSIHGIFSTFADPALSGIGYGAAIALLLPLSFILRPIIPSEWTIMLPVFSYAAMLILIDFHLEGFPHWGPTGAITRIISHMLPALFFYVLLRVTAPVAPIATDEINGVRV